MARGLRSGPFLIHVVLGIATLALLAVGHYAARSGESYAPFFVPPSVIVWILLGVVVVVLAKQSGPSRLIAWLVPFAFPLLAFGVGLAFLDLL